MRNNYVILLLIPMLLCFLGCEKFLSERPTSSVSNILSLQDMQAMMDAGNKINLGNYFGLLDVASDDFFVGKGGFDRLDDFHKSIYLWEEEPFYTLEHEPSAWTNPYHIIAIANNVLDELQEVEITKGLSRHTIEGTALFHRAFTYVNLVQAYCNAYDPATAMTDLGLPMRLSSDISLPSVRSSLAETYRIIEQDISRAIELLPMNSEFRTRPNKVAAHALMARLYLLMERYPEALEHASDGLSSYSTLLDFNRLDVSRPFPIQVMNEETIFFAFASGASILNPTRECYIDTILYGMYHEKDLRKQIFFKHENNGYYTFRGSYRGVSSINSFVGLTVSELRLIQAEALVRMGRLDESLQALNHLLLHRYEQGYFEPMTPDNQDILLNRVLEERRKELIFRGARWADLKRLNRDPRFAKTLYRRVPGSEEIHQLPPNDPRYVFLIPETVVEATGLEQNPR